MFVNQIAAPVVNSFVGSDPSVPRTRPRTSRPTDHVFVVVIAAINPRLNTRVRRVRRAIRPGFTMIKPASSTPSAAGMIHVRPNVKRGGSTSCNMIATMTATAAGQRASQEDTLRHAGVKRCCVHCNASRASSATCGK